jgi:hypothetical protein
MATASPQQSLLSWVLARPVAQAAYGAVAAVALGAQPAFSGRQLQLLVQAAARGAVQGAASHSVEGEASGPIQEELASRLEAVKPVLEEYIVAASSAREPKVSGVARVRRNLAVHCAFGEGPAVLQGTAKQLRARQRGARKNEVADLPSGAAVRLHNTDGGDPSAADDGNEYDGSSLCGTSTGFDGSSYETSSVSAIAHVLVPHPLPVGAEPPSPGQLRRGLEKDLHGQSARNEGGQGAIQASSTESACGAGSCTPVGKKKKLRDLQPCIVDRIAAIKCQLVVDRISKPEEAGLLEELRQLQSLLPAAE